MTRYVSKSAQCIFDSDFNSDLPDDILEITPELHMALHAGYAQGKRINYDVYPPELADPLPLSAEQLVIDARVWRDGELSSSDPLVARHRDERDMGDTTLTTAQFSALLDYRQALREWPTDKAFPDGESRPVAPDWLAGPAPKQ
jgi:hypothetical protein